MKKNLFLLLFMLVSLAFIPVGKAKSVFVYQSSEELTFESFNDFFIGMGNIKSEITFWTVNYNDLNEEVDRQRLYFIPQEMENNKSIQLIRDKNQVIYGDNLKDFGWSGMTTFNLKDLNYYGGRNKSLKDFTISGLDLKGFEKGFIHILYKLLVPIIDLRFESIGLDIDVNNYDVIHQDMWCKKEGRALKCKKEFSIEFSMFN